MLDMALNNALADHKTYGNVEMQHRLFARLRREDPVHWTEPAGFRPFWTVTKYADIIEIERQADRFINAPRTKLLSVEFESKVREAMNGGPMLVRALPQMDNPDHAKYQKLTHAWFQPRQLRTLSDRMEALASAGHDTTSATIAGGLLALIENPEAMARLQRDGDLIPDAAEEMVRWVSPVKHFFRTAAVDYEIRGKKIKPGDSLFISYPSGNRDEEAFDRPFEFLPDRSPNRHLGFGFGIHACIGRHLAKAEIVAFFREFFKRVDRVELAGKPAWTETSFLGGVKRLPVRYRAR